MNRWLSFLRHHERLFGARLQFITALHGALLSVASVLPAIVYILVGLTLSLRAGDTTTTVALMATLVTSILLALRNSLIASVRDMPLLLLASVVVISARHRVFSC